MSVAAPESKTVRIDVVSDVVCPWCFIGKSRLEKALKLKPDIPVEIYWRPYFLNDWIPREGIPRQQYLTTKFGSVERYEGIAQRVGMAARQEGLVYDASKLSNQPNTIDCHRLIRWAAERGENESTRMKQRLMEMYFSEGADLTQRDTLVEAAIDCGFDERQVRADLESDKDIDTITREAEQAKEAGIQGVPCFIFGGMLAVSGAQDPQHLADAIQRVSDELAKGVAAE